MSCSEGCAILLIENFYARLYTKNIKSELFATTKIMQYMLCVYMTSFLLQELKPPLFRTINVGYFCKKKDVT